MRTRTTVLLLLGVLVLARCDSNGADGDGAGEEELITRATIMLVGPLHTVFADAIDPDGSGAGFTVETLDLYAGEYYTGSISLCDDVNHRNVSGEVLDEAEFHQLFYTVTGGARDRVTVTVTDRDASGLPLGLTFTVRVLEGGPTTGQLTVMLCHYADETKNGVDPSSQIDLELTFPVTIHG